MDFQELIEKINRNTAAQVEQNKTWRLELGLPEREPTELELLLQKWELESAKEAKQSPAPEELVLSQEPEEEELPLPEPRGEELPLPEPRGEKLPLPEHRGEEPKSIPPPLFRPPPLQSSPALMGTVPCPVLVPLPEHRGEEPKSIPPPLLRPPPLQSSPALMGTVPCPVLVDTLPECMDLPPLDHMPRSQHCQAQLGARSPAPLLPDPETSRRGRQTSHALPLPSTLFPSRSQTSLRRSRATHFCLSQLAPGHRPVFRSPLASHLGPSSPDRGPFHWAPDFKGGGNVALEWPISAVHLRGGKCNIAGMGLILPAWKKTCANAHVC
ncbi:UNVERIFIED_CONTAM: hypothetical protein FKN15_017521 [Acipenser sinensis]